MPEIRNELPEPALKIIEKRGVVYARNIRNNELAFKLKYDIFVPKRMVHVPKPVVAWIENLIKKDEDSLPNWPWFKQVYSFVKSKEYALIQSQIEREYLKAKAADIDFWLRLKSKSVPAREVSNFPNEKKFIDSKNINFKKDKSDFKLDRKATKILTASYFWDEWDPSWWREQE